MADIRNLLNYSLKVNTLSENIKELDKQVNNIMKELQNIIIDSEEDEKECE